MRLVRLFLTGLFLAGFFVGSVPAKAQGEWQDVPGQPFRKKAAEGHCNCLFAPTEIMRGGEARAGIRSAFAGPEPVYARCYFDGPIGPLAPDDFWHELWIDGRMVKITEFAHPPQPDWDQISLWLTAEDYSTEFKALPPGRHEITLWVLKNTYLSYPDPPKLEENRSPVLVRLSKGSFIYTVPKR
jgi:hypothetical protein